MSPDYFETLNIWIIKGPLRLRKKVVALLSVSTIVMPFLYNR